MSGPEAARSLRAPIAVLLGAIGIALFLAGWTLAAWRLHNVVLLPSPAQVVGAYGNLLADGSLLRDVRASLLRVFAGFGIAASLAVPIALLLAYSWPLRCMVLPLITLIRPIPPIAWIPLSILWLGLGDPPSYLITAIAAFFPIFINSFAGGLAIEREHVNAARSLGARRRALLLRIMLPSALPMIVTGLKIGLGQSWMAVVTAELIAAQSGLGYMIQVSRLNLETASVLVGMTVIGLLGAIMTSLLGVAERRLILPWHFVR
jgi:NitT/TauT family transport system permease protein